MGGAQRSSLTFEKSVYDSYTFKIIYESNKSQSRYLLL